MTAYEELRQHMLASSPGGSHFGLVVLLREGIAAWIERLATCRGPAAPSGTQPAFRLLLSDQQHAEIVHVLAEIALKSREEVKP